MLNATQIVTNELRPIDIRTDLRPAPETILVVEDEAFVREATCDILESEGYRVLRARNATEAQTAFRQNHGSVQLLLSDVVLPGQNGPALAKDLQEAHQALPAIFISGWPEATVTRYGLAAGQMLPKPFSAESLLHRVKQALQSKEARISG